MTGKEMIFVDENMGGHFPVATVDLKTQKGVIWEDGSVQLAPKFALYHYCDHGIYVACNEASGFFGLAKPVEEYSDIERKPPIWTPRLCNIKEVVVDFEYDFLGKYGDGLIPARKDGGGKVGYIDLEGCVVIDFLFDKCESFKDGYAFVKQDNLWGVIDTGGEYVLAPQYECIRSAYDDDTFSVPLWAVKREGKWGIMDHKWTWIVEPYFDRMSSLRLDGGVLVDIGDEKGVLHFLDTFMDTIRKKEESDAKVA